MIGWTTTEGGVGDILEPVLIQYRQVGVRSPADRADVVIAEIEFLVANTNSCTSSVCQSMSVVTRSNVRILQNISKTFLLATRGFMRSNWND